jgi:hypothetical protein
MTLISTHARFNLHDNSRHSNRSNPEVLNDDKEI